MERIRRFLIFLLFFALLSTAAYILFGREIRDWSVNIRTGAGLTEYLIVTQGADEKTYALGYSNGWRIVCLTEEGREFDRKIASGLPDHFSVSDMHVTGLGSVLLTLYGSDDMGMEF